MARYAVCFSRGIRSIRHIEQFVAVDRLLLPTDRWNANDEVCVVVWGRKDNTRKALAFANSHGLKVIHLEDGFIRTASDDSHSRTCYSIVVDKKGVYYDATVSSDLELFLNSNNSEIDRAMEEAGLELIQACMETIVENNITKYNYCSDFIAKADSCDRKKVLVVDQTLGDASVVYGGMDESAFVQMLEAAVAENPGADVRVKTHPDVISGHRSGYLVSRAKELGVPLCSEAVNPISLLIID